MRPSVSLLPVLLLLSACAPPAPAEQTGSSSSWAAASIGKAWNEFTEEDWRKVLPPERYAILREAGTERRFTSELLHEKRAGTYVTADCGDPVFRSEQKYESGTGWPSFWAPISPDAVTEVTDTAFGMTRTEIRSRCGGHLGHVFTDGPEPTGLRYCMNGLALRFIPDEPETE